MIYNYLSLLFFFFFFKQKTAYEMRISDWSSDVCSSDLLGPFDRRCPLAQACSHARPTLSRLSTISDKIVPQPRDGDKEVKLGRQALQIGRASCRERVCQYV